MAREANKILEKIRQQTEKIKQFKERPPIEKQLATEPNNLDEIVRRHGEYVGLVRARQELIEKYIESVK